ncbi:carboxy-S-adenosyl-L-methionine synthase CmoA [Desulfogranum japonicum]|uniref:carboxy-S-adenosyl-L-methionine synthase CmoA n=1 Tax=Desulfogranum japonicum TaxID=231447 RepID=UPI00041B943A|nr:carboxy-S-adenosyl-L-methionine synthase CmoA [Desulfogranum japonicum]
MTDRELQGKDRLFAKKAITEDFSFSEQVADVFDDMLNRSIPFYEQVTQATADLLERRLKDNQVIYDLGCSTGATLLALSRRLEHMKVRYVGMDNAVPMIEKATRKSAQYQKEHLLSFEVADITSAPLPNAGAIICNYTMQFLRPITRQDFLQKLYTALPDGGLLFLSEKTISHAKQLNREFISIYHQFKKKQGYSELEIAAKREALENILIPFSVQENTHLLKETGFSEVELFFTWFNFSSWVAIK